MRAPARARPFALLILVTTAATRPPDVAATARQSAQQPAGAPTTPATVGVTASRVAVDLVARDKKGRLVRDLDTVRHAAVPLPRPDPDGEVRVVDGLPLDGVAAGEYTPSLALRDARSMVSRTAEVALAC
jgi:hypothetical protein